MTLELVLAVLALALAAVMLAGKVVDYFKDNQRKNGSGNGTQPKSASSALTNTEMRCVHDWTRDLHQWHAKEDEDGRKVWYNDRALGEAMKKIGEAMTVQTEILRRMADRVDRALDDKE